LSTTPASRYDTNGLHYLGDIGTKAVGSLRKCRQQACPTGIGPGTSDVMPATYPARTESSETSATS
jgi:hypothetical protein